MIFKNRRKNSGRRKFAETIADNVGALRRRVPEPVTPWRQLIKDTKAGHLYCRSSVIRQPGGELDLKTALDFTRQQLAQNPLLPAGFYQSVV